MERFHFLPKGPIKHGTQTAEKKRENKTSPRVQTGRRTHMHSVAVACIVLDQVPRFSWISVQPVRTHLAREPLAPLCFQQPFVLRAVDGRNPAPPFRNHGMMLPLQYQEPLWFQPWLQSGEGFTWLNTLFVDIHRGIILPISPKMP